MKSLHGFSYCLGTVERTVKSFLRSISHRDFNTTQSYFAGFDEDSNRLMMQRITELIMKIHDPVTGLKDFKFES
jgi:hypothetical protein